MLDQQYEIYKNKPEILHKFKTYRICLLYRNPYERLVSSFINKYVRHSKHYQIILNILMNFQKNFKF